MASTGSMYRKSYDPPYGMSSAGHTPSGGTSSGGSDMPVVVAVILTFVAFLLGGMIVEATDGKIPNVLLFLLIAVIDVALAILYYGICGAFQAGKTGGAGNSAGAAEEPPEETEAVGAETVFIPAEEPASPAASAAQSPSFGQQDGGPPQAMPEDGGPAAAPEKAEEGREGQRAPAGEAADLPRRNRPLTVIACMMGALLVLLAVLLALLLEKRDASGDGAGHTAVAVSATVAPAQTSVPAASVSSATAEEDALADDVLDAYESRIDPVQTARPTARPTATPKSAAATGRSAANADSYDAGSYVHPDDFYYDYYDDFWDYEDAEDYWEEWNR